MRSFLAGTAKDIFVVRSSGMMLEITQNRFIHEVQSDFNRLYPFLKLEFYNCNGSRAASKRQHLLNSMPVAKAGLTRNGNIEVNDLMTVGELEKILQTEFGLSAQVSRKSGVIWLETTMTDSWTLKKQNEHGKELSDVIVNDNGANDYDF